MSPHRAITDPAAGRAAGLTVVELMISLLLASMLSAGLFYMVNGQKKTYESQIDSVNLQESLWSAAGYLRTQISLAGYGFGGCPQNGSVSDGSATTNQTLIGLRIFDGCEVAQHNLDANGLNCATPNISTNSDSFAIMMINPTTLGNLNGANYPRGVLDATHLSGELVLKKPTPLPSTWDSGFRNNDWVIIWTNTTPGICIVRQLINGVAPYSNFGAGVTAGTGGFVATNTVSMTTNSLVVHTGENLATYTAGTLNFLKARYFSIDRRRTVPRLVTWTSDFKQHPADPSADLASNSFEIIAEGIEDMQIAWGCDGDANGTIAQGLPNLANDEWVGNLPGGPASSDNAPAACASTNIQQVRITLIARATQADPSFSTGKRPAAEDRPAGTSTEDQTTSGNLGTYPRRVLTFTVQPRNLARAP